MDQLNGEGVRLRFQREQVAQHGRQPRAGRQHDGAGLERDVRGVVISIAAATITIGSTVVASDAAAAVTTVAARTGVRCAA